MDSPDPWNGNRWKGGRGKTKYVFTYEDIANLLEVKVETVRQLVFRKELDPHSLKSICLAWWRRNKERQIAG